MKIFGVPIEGASVEQVLARVESTPSALWIVTANPEILLAAERDQVYRDTLLQADLRLVDGVGLRFIGRCYGQAWPRVTGVRLGEVLLAVAAKHDWKVALLGGQRGVAERAADRWQRCLPGLNIRAEVGGRVNQDGTDDESGEEARHRLTLFAPQVLLVAFGHPKQERWIARHLSEFPQIRVVMGVGGAFDYWAGSVRRAPAWLGALGLEWLWRGWVQPWRLRRIIRAVCIFPIRAVAERVLFATNRDGRVKNSRHS